MPDLEDLERRIKRIEDKLGIVDKYPYEFEDLAAKLDQRTWEDIWQGMDTHLIAPALVGLNREQLTHLKPTFSKTRWAEIEKELSAPSGDGITQSSIDFSRRYIVQRAFQMEEQGLIVIGGRPKDKNQKYYSIDEIFNKKEPPVDVQGWLHSTFEKI